MILYLDTRHLLERELGGFPRHAPLDVRLIHLPW